MKPLIIQSDHSLFLEVENQEYAACRDFLVNFAELVKSPDYMHTYRTTPLSLWNAAALNCPLEKIVGGIEKYSKYTVPKNVLDDIKNWYNQYGKIILEKYNEYLLILTSSDQFIFDKIINDKSLQTFWQIKQEHSVLINKSDRGNIKHALIKAGYPVKDLCGYSIGEKLDIDLRKVDIFGNEFALRDYQSEAIEAFYHAGGKTGGSGIIVLPCGTGKTIIGLGVITAISNHTLIITTNNISVKQWMNELLQKTSITEDYVGQYTGNSKEIKPITVTNISNANL